jgi:hypothetical protein
MRGQVRSEQAPRMRLLGAVSGGEPHSPTDLTFLTSPRSRSVTPRPNSGVRNLTRPRGPNSPQHPLTHATRRATSPRRSRDATATNPATGGAQ